jgi:hypothetical protein
MVPLNSNGLRRQTSNLDDAFPDSRCEVHWLSPNRGCTQRLLPAGHVPPNPAADRIARGRQIVGNGFHRIAGGCRQHDACSQAQHRVLHHDPQPLVRSRIDRHPVRERTAPSLRPPTALGENLANPLDADASDDARPHQVSLQLRKRPNRKAFPERHGRAGGTLSNRPANLGVEHSRPWTTRVAVNQAPYPLPLVASQPASDRIPVYAGSRCNRSDRSSALPLQYDQRTRTLTRRSMREPFLQYGRRPLLCRDRSNASHADSPPRLPRSKQGAVTTEARHAQFPRARLRRWAICRPATPDPGRKDQPR